MLVDGPDCVSIHSRSNFGSLMTSLHWMIGILTVKKECSQDSRGTIYGETTSISGACWLSTSNELLASLRSRLRQQNPATAAAATSTAALPITAPTMVGTLTPCAAPDAAVVVWDGAEVVLGLLVLELRFVLVVLVVLLQWVLYMLLFVAASSFKAKFMVASLMSIF
jgi:hypothetical protein